MKQIIAHISLLVKDYNEAIAFYTKKLGFKLIEDKTLSPEKRWVLITASSSKEFSILLAKATTEEQLKCIGNQSGGRVFLFLYTDDFWRDYKKMTEKKIVFIETPREESYGTVAVFEDLYGNKWDLIQTKEKMKKHKSVDDYIATFDKDVQLELQNIRDTILKNAPNAVESISYGMPAYKINKKPLVYFAGYKNHIGFYATPNGHSEFEKDLSKYKHGKGSVQFPINENIPFELIKKIVLFRVKEIS